MRTALMKLQIQKICVFMAEENISNIFITWTYYDTVFPYHGLN